MLWWLAALLLIPACWLYSACADGALGLAVGRSADAVTIALILLLGCLQLQKIQTPTRRERPGTVGDQLRRLARSPLAWAGAALLWQFLVWAAVAPVHAPGAIWLIERLGTLTLAWGLMLHLSGRGSAPSWVWSLALYGALLLVFAGAARLLAPQIAFLLYHPQWPPHTGPLVQLVVHGLSALGVEAPFGNQNFNIAAGLPLLGMSGVLWMRERQARPAGWAQAVLIAGWCGCLLIILGIRTDGSGEPFPGLIGRALQHLHLTRNESTIGGGVEILVLIGMLAVMRLPARAQLPAVLVPAVVLLVAQWLVMEQRVDTPFHAPSSQQRIWLWRCGVEGVAQQPLIGYGAGSAIAVLNHQEHFSECYLMVPSWPEHPHHELIEILLDGGIVNLGLVAGLLVTTLGPLWRRRAEPGAWAVLTAWGMTLVHATLDVQMSQPGPLLSLALLTGVSWALVREGEPVRPFRTPLLRQVLLVVGMVPLLCFVIAELTGKFGSPPELYEHWRRQMIRPAMAPRQGDEVGRQLWLLEGLIADLGPLDNLYYQRARLLLYRAPVPMEEVRGLLLKQSHILPILPHNLHLLALLERTSDEQRDFVSAREIEDRLGECLDRARECLARVPENPKNEELRASIQRLLEGGPVAWTPVAPPKAQPAPPAPRQPAAPSATAARLTPSVLSPATPVGHPTSAEATRTRPSR